MNHEKSIRKRAYRPVPRFVRLTACGLSARLCFPPAMLDHLGLLMNDYVELTKLDGGRILITPMKGHEAWTRHEVEAYHSIA